MFLPAAGGGKRKRDGMIKFGNASHRITNRFPEFLSVFPPLILTPLNCKLCYFQRSHDEEKGKGKREKERERVRKETG